MQRQDDGIIERFPIWDDIKTFDGIPWRGRVDVVSGGFPCQAFSSAARGANNAENLWPEMRRVVADVAPRYVFTENVSKQAIDYAADELEQMGYATKAVAISASDLGADHIRKRYWLLAYPHSHRELLRQEHAEVAELPRVYSNIWKAEPNQPRVADGMANRMDRLEATGNGQVPAVAALAWRILTNLNPHDYRTQR